MRRGTRVFLIYEFWERTKSNEEKNSLLNSHVVYSYFDASDWLLEDNTIIQSFVSIVDGILHNNIDNKANYTLIIQDSSLETKINQLSSILDSIINLHPKFEEKKDTPLSVDDAVSKISTQPSDSTILSMYNDMAQNEQMGMNSIQNIDMTVPVWNTLQYFDPFSENIVLKSNLGSKSVSEISQVSWSPMSLDLDKHSNNYVYPNYTPRSAWNSCVDV